MTLAIGRRVLAVVVALAAAAVIGWRVLAPAEVLAPATDGYPVAAIRPPGVTGRAPGAPLIVDGRVRVFAAPRQVRADAPVDAKTYGTPRWSFRRWPQQLNGMVAVGTTVVTRWSDGALVALDARTGGIAWRAAGPAAGGYHGRRTGASTVWAPTGLHTSGTTVLVNGGGRLLALDALTGARRWQADLPGGCAAEDGFTTLGRRYVCDTGAYDITTGRPVPGGPGPAGAVTPLGCAVAASACGGLRDVDGHGWLTTGATPRRAAALDPPGSTLASGLALSLGGSAAGSEIVARDPVTGAEVWRRPAPAGTQLLAAQPGMVHLLTGARELITLDAATGVPRSAFPLARPGEQITWAAGSVQAADGFVAVERLRSPPDPDADDADYYFAADTVILAAT